MSQVQIDLQRAGKQIELSTQGHQASNVGFFLWPWACFFDLWKLHSLHICKRNNPTNVTGRMRLKSIVIAKALSTGFPCLEHSPGSECANSIPQSPPWVSFASTFFPTFLGARKDLSVRSELGKWLSRAMSSCSKRGLICRGWLCPLREKGWCGLRGGCEGNQDPGSALHVLTAALPQGFPLHAPVLEQSPPGAEMSSDRVQPPTQPRHWQQSPSELPRSREGEMTCQSTSACIIWNSITRCGGQGSHGCHTRPSITQVLHELDQRLACLHSQLALSFVVFTNPYWSTFMDTWLRKSFLRRRDCMKGFDPATS